MSGCVRSADVSELCQSRFLCQICVKDGRGPVSSLTPLNHRAVSGIDLTLAHCVATFAHAI